MNNLLYSPSDVFAVARGEAEITNILNNDVYKFLMMDFINAQDDYRDLNVRWEMTIRSKDVRTAEVIPLEALKEQLDAAKAIEWVSDADISYMRWMLWPTDKRMFQEETLAYLKTFSLPDYTIGNNWDWNYTLSFEWKWMDSMMWEIFGLKIINTLYNFHYIEKEKLSNVEFTRLMNTVLWRLFTDIDILKGCPDAQFSEFGTRRSLSTDYQRMVNQILSEELPGQYLWTSNVLIAKEMWWSNPIWTNAHELRMIPTALHDDPKKIIDTMYDVDRNWQKHHEWLGILLPDTFGTSYYYENAPGNVIEWHTGTRFDSKDPMVAIPEYVSFLLERWIDPQTKIGIPSDGLTAEKIVSIQNKFRWELGKLSYWMGTNLTNNTKWVWPREEEPLGPFGSFSVVVKPSEVQRSNWDWVSTVKRPDNLNKTVWSAERVRLFEETFGNQWMEREETLV